ncbi:hypothetical protein C4D60_Mb04t23210 [Musa balbisiana]|uniref:Uncharacterized protein n=1 Tax=Musa balbisiana TaxID=52838 RepID=A0A4S8KE49_MUSBA|nr:hypothetical protein C4D60_Mb04t23210 [Musa balbisiana]
MADRGCNNACGCVVPCPGGNACRCSTGGGGEVQHTLCTCGDHCNCNPCACGGATAAGKASCTCRPNCGCAACSAA